MCSITERVAEVLASGSPASPALVAAAVEHVRASARAVADLLGAEGSASVVAGMPADAVAGLATSMLGAADAASAVATSLVGQVDATTGPGASCLIAGQYASARRWLEVEGRLSTSSAKTMLARARDLRGHSAVVGEAWLAGRVPGDAVRDLTVSVSSALKRVDAPVAEVGQLRVDALDVLVPLAETVTPGEVRRAVQRLRFALDPDGASQDAMDAYDSQSLTLEVVGPMSRLTVWMTHENAVAAMTVIDQEARRMTPGEGGIVHAEDCALVLAAQPDTADAVAAGEGAERAEDAGGQPTSTCDAASEVDVEGATEPEGAPVACTCGAVSTASWAHTRAVAFGAVMAGMLDHGMVGSHHGVAPHVTLTVDLDDALAALSPDGEAVMVGELAMPGRDEPVLVPDATVRRILCDADLVRVITTHRDAGDIEAQGTEAGAAHGPGSANDPHHDVIGSAATAGQRGWHRAHRLPVAGTTRARGIREGSVPRRGAIETALHHQAREVLWAGRSERTVPPRMRRALEVRDRHCVFPGCTAPPRRCHAHHVQHWEHDGGTDLDNLALICVAHHHAVHEGGWTIARAPGAAPGAAGAWRITPPARATRP